MRTPRILKLGDGTVLVERFTLIERIEHVFVIVCVLILFATGLSQKFYDSSLAASFLQLLGGLDSTRSVHHLTGVVLAAYLFVHTMWMVGGISLGKIRLSLLPVPKDFKNIIANWRYNLGYTRERPPFEMFNYRQKFEYLGLVMGGAVVILSGVVLLLGPKALQILPGHVMPAAREAHANDALLAFAVLIVWHLYSNLVSPDSRPLNLSIFTGYVTKDELKSRHALVYERLFGDGGNSG